MLVRVLAFGIAFVTTLAAAPSGVADSTCVSEAPVLRACGIEDHYYDDPNCDPNEERFNMGRDYVQVTVAFLAQAYVGGMMICQGGENDFEARSVLVSASTLVASAEVTSDSGESDGGRYWYDLVRGDVSTVASEAEFHWENSDQEAHGERCWFHAHVVLRPTFTYIPYDADCPVPPPSSPEQQWGYLLP